MIERHVSGYVGRGRRPVYGGPLFVGPLTRVGLVGIVLLFVAASFSGFWPIVFWMGPFFLLPALGFFARGLAGFLDGRSSPLPDISDDRKEKELLKALERRGGVTPARAALETSLTISEADRMLSE